MEIWKTISIECLNDYEISTLGNIRHHKHKRNIKFTKLRYGHLQFGYKQKGIKKNFKVHRLVLITFTGDHPDMVVNHINNIPYDNRLENLEWLTPGDNTRHYYNNFYESKTEKQYTLKRLKELLISKTWNSAEDFVNSLKS